MSSLHLVVMGVAGSGKTTVANLLHDQLGWPLAEADDFHPRANIDKMSAGIPLTDEDRWPWLDAIVGWTREHAEAGTSTLATCSALKRAYRYRLRNVEGTWFIHLSGTQELLEQRMRARQGHFMPASLLPSQFETLEDLESDEPGMTFDTAQETHFIVGQILSWIKEQQ